MPKEKKTMFWPYNGNQPNYYVGSANAKFYQVSAEDRKLVCRFLKRGKITVRYRGMALCRCCKQMLGSSDMMNGHYIYPEKCWHYIERHDIWTDELQELLEYLKS